VIAFRRSRRVDLDQVKINDLPVRMPQISTWRIFGGLRWSGRWRSAGNFGERLKVSQSYNKKIIKTERRSSQIYGI
jgi:hypothetical protein